MPEVDRQLLKLPNLEDNIKGLVIPTLNFFLNSTQFDVPIPRISPRRRPARNWGQWRTS